jgi:peptidoglycan/xylan/chitin deacetylase (PgdA/CDA1 family)
MSSEIAMIQSMKALKRITENDKQMRERNKATAFRGLKPRIVPITNFESSDPSNIALAGGISANTTDFSSGLRSVKITGNNIDLAVNSTWDLSLADAFAIDVMLHTTVSNLSSFQLKFFTDSSFTKGFQSGNIYNRIRLDNTFHSIPVRKAELTSFGGAINTEWSSVKRVEIIAIVSVPNGISFDNFRGIIYPTKRGKVVLRFDDGYQSNITEAATYMAMKGFAGFACLISKRMIDQGVYNGRPILTLEQAKKLQEQGWDIGSHTKEHFNLPGLDNSPAVLDEAIRHPYEWLKQNGFTGERFFVHPGHGVSRPNHLKVKEYHTLAYCGADCIDTLPPQSPLTMHSFITENKTAAQIKTYIDDVATNGGLLTITFHDIISSGTPDTNFQVTQATFRSVIDYLVTSSVDVVTLTDLVEGGHLAVR